MVLKIIPRNISYVKSVMLRLWLTCLQREPVLISTVPLKIPRQKSGDFNAEYIKIEQNIPKCTRWIFSKVFYTVCT